MKAGTRLIIVGFGVALFLTAAPYMVLHSMGYRVDFENREVITTGGIYVRTAPAAVSVAVGNQLNSQAGLFSDYSFFQNLLPGKHDILITKDGYNNYQKTVLVKEKEVAKLENIILFKKDILFETVDDESLSPFDKEEEPERFVLKKGGLYYNIESKNLPEEQKDASLPIIKNVLAYSLSGNNLIWLETDGFIYRAEIERFPLPENQNIQSLNKKEITVNKNKAYQLYVFSRYIFIKENGNLRLLDNDGESFKELAPLVKDLKPSPDEQKAAYYSDNEIFIWNFKPKNEEDEILSLGEFSGKISDVQWMNNDYIVLTAGNNIIISEVDARGGVNKTSLPDAIKISDKETVKITNPQIFFDQKEKKLYILSDKVVLVSEKLIP